MIVSIGWILVTNFVLFNYAQDCTDRLETCGLIAKNNLCESQRYYNENCCKSCGGLIASSPINFGNTNKK